MSSPNSPQPADGPPDRAVWAIPLSLFGLIVAGSVAYLALRKPPPPPPAEVAADPLLLEGRSIYLDRCQSCHGPSGRGDGPIAKGLAGPPVGDLADDRWKHGDQPDQVLTVLRRGVSETAMPAWETTLEPQQIRAVAGYVYYLAGRPVPESIRTD